MKYKDYRVKIKSGDLIAYTHYGWSSWYDIQVQIVRMATRSQFSHVGMALELGGRLFILEAVTPVIRLVPLSGTLGKHGFYHIPLEADISSDELEFALSKIGKGKYSKLEAVMAQLRKLRIGEDDLWECAEYVICCRKFSGIDLGSIATPAEVVESALRIGDRKSVV